MDQQDIEFNFLHPSKDIKGSLGNELSNKKIVLCITASIACYRSIDLIRLLIRHGANVYVVISKDVKKFISKEYFHWASGNYVITNLTGKLEHVYLADYNRSDLILVYPSTANTISKFANGIDDTPPTSILSVALGSKIPIIIAPAMHESMYDNEIINENITKLQKKGVVFVNPKIEEGKAKIADIEDVVQLVIKKVNLDSINNNNFKSKTCDLNLNFYKNPSNDLLNIDINKLNNFFKTKTILISLGGTIEYIDPIRIISNTSSGKMGFALTNNALSFGSNVTVVKGNTTINWLDEKNEHYSSSIASKLKLLEVKTSQQMNDAILGELRSKKYDIVILAAAVSDFKPAEYIDHKLSSKESISLNLIPTIKIINNIKKTDDQVFLISFKADWNVSSYSLLRSSYEKIINCKADLVVANDVGKRDSFIGSDQNEVLVLNKNKSYYHIPIQNKFDVSLNIFKIIYLEMVHSL